MFPDLVGLFDSIEIPIPDLGTSRFSVRPVRQHRACLVGKDTDGGPVLLIEIEETVQGIAAPVLLESLCVLHYVRCRVQSPGHQERERLLTVIRCTTPDRIIHEYFLRCLVPIIASLPDRPTREHVAEAIRRLTELFRTMSSPPKKLILGLWAELFVIAHASDPTRLINAWHATPEEKYDFAEGNFRLEVKATLGTLRVHHFNLEQLRPTDQLSVLIISILVEQTTAGLNVYDLVDRIRSRVIHEDQLVRLDSVIAQTIGTEWRSLHQLRFNESFAMESMRLIPAELIPAIPTPVPPSVTLVHFRVDLSNAHIEHQHDHRPDDGFFHAAYPKDTSHEARMPENFDRARRQDGD